jgi:hypothetical protein
MSGIMIRVLDTTGSRAREVEAPDDAPVERLLVLLVERMGLPLNAPDGQLMSYKLHDRRTGRLRLQAEITAGAVRR